MSKRARLTDFKRRTAYDPSGTQELDGLGRIIAVHSPPGTYARRAEHGRLNIVIVVPSPMISSTCVITELRRVASMVGALDSACPGTD